MEKYITCGSTDKPEINLDHETGILFIGGTSLPENVLEVYRPVVDWLEKYIKQPQQKTQVRFFFEYLNTASSHMVMQLMEKFLQLKDVCEEFKIIWYYDKTDIDMRDFGEELMDLTNFPIELLPRENQEF